MQSGTTLPVFVFPTQLTFYLKDSSTHRHLLTIYNPYDFVVTYQVLCTSPANYSVVEPEGVLKSRCCIDIAIRRLNLQPYSLSSLTSSPSTSTPRRVDKFRVYVKRRDKSEVCGQRDVVAEILDRKIRESENESTASDFRGWPKTEAQVQLSPNTVQYPLPSTRAPGRPGWLLMIVAGICIACLSAPAPGEQLSSISIPEWLTMSMPQKLVAAYVLGLVTAAFLQS